MKLRFMKGRMSGHMVDVLPTGFVIGRGSGCELAIDEEGISRRHARIFFEDGTWFIEDLGSTNGVRVNGTKVAGRFCIKNGDRIGLFNQTLLFTDASEVVDVDTLTVPGTAVLPPPSSPKVTPVSKDVSSQPSRSSMGALTVVALLILVAALAWFARESFKDGSDHSPGQQTTEETDQGDTSQVAVTEAGDSESQGIVIEIPGLDDPLPKEEAPDIVQVPVVDGAAAVVVAGEIKKEAANMFVESIPSGAAVSLDGLAKGKTPIMLRDIPAGDHDLVLSLSGYDTLEQKVRLPDDIPNRPYMLNLAPGAVQVTSEPNGATVWHGTQMIGTTPFVTTELPAGSQEIRIRKYGFDPKREKVLVSATIGTRVKVVLEAQTGALELVTIPAGCNVYIDDFFKGKTVPREGEKTGKSAALRITGLKEGKHQIRVEHLSGTAKSEVVTIKSGEVGTAFFELWVVDTKVSLRDGTEKFGMLIGVNDDGDVTLSEKTAGVTGNQTRTYFDEQVVKTETLSPIEARAKTEDILAAQETTDQTAGQVPEKNNLLEQMVQSDDETLLTCTTLTLNTMIQKMGAVELIKQIGSREVLLSGVPTAVKLERTRAHIYFGKTISCEMSQDDYDKVSQDITAAQEIGTVISLRGKMIAKKQGVTLTNCAYQEKAQ